MFTSFSSLEEQLVLAREQRRRADAGALSDLNPPSVRKGLRKLFWALDAEVRGLEDRIAGKTPVVLAQPEDPFATFDTVGADENPPRF